MLRRSLGLALIAGVLASVPRPVQAGGAWLASGTLTPVEQRVAIAVTPGRTTLWTSLRFQGSGGSMAIVVPAPPGSSLDFSSDAWFEALEVATAPRIFPPSNVDPYCAGKSGSPDPFQIAGTVSHTASLAAQELAVLDAPDKVLAWASQSGLVVSAPLATAIGKITGQRFVAVRFDAPQGSGVTPTLRVVMPSTPASLPLALTQATADDLQVTTWVLGLGRADLIGATQIGIAPSSISWNAAQSTSDYEDQRSSALADDPTRFLIEAASHDSFVKATPIASGTASIDALVTTYFERAAAYGDGAFDSAACLAVTEPALDASQPVATSCPHASLGIIAPVTNCTESTPAGQIDPATLRCGPGADDLAVALSNLVPKDAWITRQSLTIPSSSAGHDWSIGIVPAPPTSPVIHAGKVDYGECTDGGVPDGGMMSSSSSSSGHGVIVHDYGASPGTGPDVGASVGPTAADVADATCACLSAGAEAAAASNNDSCSSDGTSTDTCSGSSSGDTESCSSGSGDTESCSGSGGDTESCASSGGGDSCSGGGGGESCSGGGSSGCSGGDLGKCSTAGSKSSRARGPRFSILALVSLAVLAPLRRLGRKRRDAERASRQRPAAR